MSVHCFQFWLESFCYSRTPLIERWLSGLPIVQIGLALQVNLSRILQNQLALKLPVTGSSTVHCYGF